MSETGALAKALADFQGEMPVVGKAHEAEVVMKSGGKYKYTYAGLADIVATASPILSKHGLAFTACPRQTERGYELVGRILHESGESIEGSLPVSGNTAQELGSSLTYMRRYLFGCMTGIVTDDDDDGAAASRPTEKKAERVKATEEENPFYDTPPTDPGDHQITARTNARLFALFGKKGPLDAASQLAGVNQINSTAYTSRSQITERSGLATIAVLEKRPDLPKDSDR